MVRFNIYNDQGSGRVAANTNALLEGRSRSGVLCDSRIDGIAKWWSWGCKVCGEWEDTIGSRAEASTLWKEHKATCGGSKESEEA